jgi:hypothetical protein
MDKAIAKVNQNELDCYKIFFFNILILYLKTTSFDCTFLSEIQI